MNIKKSWEIFETIRKKKQEKKQKKKKTTHK